MINLSNLSLVRSLKLNIKVPLIAKDYTFKFSKDYCFISVIRAYSETNNQRYQNNKRGLLLINQH